MTFHLNPFFMYKKNIELSCYRNWLRKEIEKVVHSVKCHRTIKYDRVHNYPVAIAIRNCMNSNLISSGLVVGIPWWSSG